VANYYATMRSNYFKVKDPDRFASFVGRCGLTLIRQALTTEGWWELASAEDCRVTGAKRRRWKTVEAWLHGFHGDGESGVPGSIDDPKTGDPKDIDFFGLLAKHLVPGQVAVVMEAGAEKMRYVCGYAWAVNAAGKVNEVSLGEIYKKAEKLAGRGVTVSPCEY
jgi:hypothetical protein